MPVPVFHINISGNVVAGYGAAVATVVAVVQFSNFLRDRVKVKITVLSDADFHVYSASDDDPYTTVTVANAGRRPVTITGVTCRKLYPEKGFVVNHCPTKLPQELTEGNHLTVYFDETEFDLCEVECWEVYDAVGHTYRQPVASLYKRLISRYRRKRWRLRKARAKKQLAADQ